MIQAAWSAGGVRVQSSWQRVVLRLQGFGSSTEARALREGLLWLTPYLMILSTLLLIAELLRLGGWLPGAMAFFDACANSLRLALPVVVWGATGAVRALQWKLPRTAVAFVCVACGLLCERLLADAGPRAQAFSIPLGLLVPLAIVPLIGWLVQRRWMQLSSQDAPAGDNVGESLNLIFPSLLTVLGVMAALSAVLAAAELLASGAGQPASPMAGAPAELLALIYAVGNSCLWLLGVHGYYALLPVLEGIPAASAGHGIVNQSFLGVFVFMGGSGATLSLLLAILMVSGLRRHRVIAMASVAPAMINVNELLLFGLPIILNPRLCVPFLLVPVSNLVVAWVATWLGLVPVLHADLPFNSPILLNGLLTGGGNPATVVLQGANLLLGAAIYAPFVQRWEHAVQGAQAAAQSAFGSVFGQRVEALAVHLDDPVSQLTELNRSRAHLMSRLASLQQLELGVHYQPQVDPLTGRMVGCEALLRMKDAQGRTQPPGEFLAVLQNADLLHDLDLWVLGTVASQVAAWRQHLPPGFRVAVNISPGTLSQAWAFDRLVAIATRLADVLVIEITENAFLGDQACVASAFKRLRDTGAALHIDDFGTGYSSLSYLHRFQVDGVKIDKSFTDTLATERGCQVFRGVCSLAETLRLEVVVEGVEQAWQLRRLPIQDGLTVQGWLYSKALPPCEFAALLTACTRFQSSRPMPEVAA